MWGRDGEDGTTAGEFGEGKQCTGDEEGDEESWNESGTGEEGSEIPEEEDKATRSKGEEDPRMPP